ncbi:hypothetical protein K435DRAFT_799185 [Dendrothele bispora CBS 962.96]|uniref:Uncharacterized protein n=1 Tax=Dendrothele bispora (strain CBS 962.96) TaxID=1314807 RepID=A0A4S8LWQ5_DENBC|nr:hypothetical protein K435DRAFT_799185 [Dendrothele bispora CBS 962.96]
MQTNASDNPTSPLSPESDDELYHDVPPGRRHLRDWEVATHLTPIDIWLRANIKELRANNQEYISAEDPRLMTSTIVKDDVLCEVKMEYNKGIVTFYDPNDPFDDTDPRDRDRFELILTVIISNEPPSPFPMLHPRVWDLKSPRILLATWYGPTGTPETPYWCRSMQVGECHSFTQPRCIITEALASIALWDDNRYQGLSSGILNWLSSVLFLQLAQRALEGVVSNTFQTLSKRSQPRNFKTTRPRAARFDFPVGIRKRSPRKKSSSRKVIENGWDESMDSGLDTF